MKYLLLILLASCSRPTYMTVTNVAEIDGKRYVYARSRWQVWRAQDDSLKRGDVVRAYPCNEKHDSVKKTEFKRIK